MLKTIDKLLCDEKCVTMTFVGDSITYGMDYCKADETFVAVFAKLISDCYKDVAIYRYDGITQGEMNPIKEYNEVIVKTGKKGRINIIRSGVGGNTVARALKRFDDYTYRLPSKKSDFIFTMFGINDALKPDENKYVTADVFKQNYNKLICDLKDFQPDAKIILMTATTSPFSVDEYNKKTFELAKEHGLNLIDLYELWNNHYSADCKNFGYGDWLSDTDDPWHPTPIGAQVMGERIFSDFLKFFG